MLVCLAGTMPPTERFEARPLPAVAWASHRPSSSLCTHGGAEQLSWPARYDAGDNRRMRFKPCVGAKQRQAASVRLIPVTPRAETLKLPSAQASCASCELLGDPSEVSKAQPREGLWKQVDEKVKAEAGRTEGFKVT